MSATTMPLRLQPILMLAVAPLRGLQGQLFAKSTLSRLSSAWRIEPTSIVVPVPMFRAPAGPLITWVTGRGPQPAPFEGGLPAEPWRA